MVRKIKKYQNIIEDLMTEEANSYQLEGIEKQIISDVKNNHFQLVETGWHEKSFIHRVIFHFDIKPDGKIWLMVNNTDTLIAEELVKRGVLPTDYCSRFSSFEYTSIYRFCGSLIDNINSIFSNPSVTKGGKQQLNRPSRQPRNGRFTEGVHFSWKVTECCKVK